jgi:hypothetical protein
MTRSALLFLLVYLSPLIPAAFLFWRIDPNKIVANSSGKLLGFTIKGGGAFGAYVALELLSLLAFQVAGKSTSGSLDPVTFSLFLRSADPQRLRQFLTSEGHSLGILLERSGSAPIRLAVSRVDPEHYSAGGEQAVPASAFGQVHHVRVLSNTVELKPEPESVTLDKTFTLNALLPPIPASGEWKSVFEVTELSHEPIASATRIVSRQIFVFANMESPPLREILFPSYEFPPIKTFVIWARKFDLATHKAIVSRWTREQVAQYNLDQMGRLLNDISLAYEQVGEELGRINATTGQPTIRIGEVKLGGNGSTPRIGPIPAGVRAGEAVVVYVDVEAEDGQTPAGEQWLGRRFFYNTDRSLMVVKSSGTLRIEQKSVALEYQRKGDAVPTFGNPRKIVTSQLVLLDLEDLEVNTFARIHWLWDKNK